MSPDRCIELERLPLMNVHCNGDGKVTVTAHFLLLDKVKFDEHDCNCFGMSCKCDISDTFTRKP